MGLAGRNNHNQQPANLNSLNSIEGPAKNKPIKLHSINQIPFKERGLVYSFLCWGLWARGHLRHWTSFQTFFKFSISSILLNQINAVAQREDQPAH